MAENVDKVNFMNKNKLTLPPKIRKFTKFRGHPLTFTHRSNYSEDLNVMYHLNLACIKYSRSQKLELIKMDQKFLLI
jgi:hypothetical protein